MSGRSVPARGASVAAAAALLVLIPAWLAVPLLEAVRGERLADTDDPVAGLTFLQESGPIVALTGIALFVVAAALVVAAAALEAVLAGGDRTRTTVPSRAVAVSAYLAAGLLALAGSLRLSSPGPVGEHLAGIDEEWGRIGYLVMHLVGTQGAIPGARLAVGAWMLGILVLGVRRQVLPRWSLALTPVPVVLLITILGPLLTSGLDQLPLPGAFWLAMMATFLLGVPLWCALVAGVLLVRRVPPVTP